MALKIPGKTAFLAAWIKEIEAEAGGHEDRPCGRTVPEAAEPVYVLLDRLAPRNGAGRRSA